MCVHSALFLALPRPDSIEFTFTIHSLARCTLDDVISRCYFPPSAPHFISISGGRRAVCDLSAWFSTQTHKWMRKTFKWHKHQNKANGLLTKNKNKKKNGLKTKNKSALREILVHFFPHLVRSLHYRTVHSVYLLSTSCSWIRLFNFNPECWSAGNRYTFKICFACRLP